MYTGLLDAGEGRRMGKLEGGYAGIGTWLGAQPSMSGCEFEERGLGFWKGAGCGAGVGVTGEGAGGWRDGGGSRGEAGRDLGCVRVRRRFALRSDQCRALAQCANERPRGSETTMGAARTPACKPSVSSVLSPTVPSNLVRDYVSAQHEFYTR